VPNCTFGGTRKCRLKSSPRENPDHDFPQRIVYRHTPPDSLHARIEGERGGETRSLDFPLARVRCPGEAAALPAQASAQEARPADVSSIDGIISAYYEVVSGPAGGAADVHRDRTLHHPSAWVAIAGRDSAGGPVVNVTDVGGYHGENRPRRQDFWEWETDRVVNRSGNMAHVWSSYAIARTPNGAPYARCVNSITLFYDGTRWWIIGWMFDSAVHE
jgi:hypothetical protein